MASKSGTCMCEYELKRLERIKENNKMLAELFPEGTSLYMPHPIKKRKSNCKRVNVQKSESGSTSGESTPEECATPQKKGCLYTVRYGLLGTF